MNRTQSTVGMPTINSFDTTLDGVDDAFVTKLSSDGNTVLYGTYLGGSGADGTADPNAHCGSVS